MEKIVAAKEKAPDLTVGGFTFFLYPDVEISFAAGMKTIAQ
jgi:hypothetical protein